MSDERINSKRIDSIALVREQRNGVVVLLVGESLVGLPEKHVWLVKVEHSCGVFVHGFAKRNGQTNLIVVASYVSPVVFKRFRRALKKIQQRAEVHRA